MIYGGNRHTELLEKQILDIDCQHCGQKSEHYLLIYCSSFVLGIFYPLHWWSRKKEGFMRCKKCGTKTKINDSSENLPRQIANYWRETKIPFTHKLPTILSIGAFMIFGYFLIFKMAAGVISALEPAEKKLPGKWEDTYKVYSLYFYHNNEFTALGYDTIAFGKYSIDKEMVHIPLFGVENSIPKNLPEKLPLTDHIGDKFSFGKTTGPEKIYSIYRQEKNRWRIQATKPQSDAELRQRILDYLNFELEKFKIADEEDLPFVDSDINSPLTIAANGYQVSAQSTEKWRLLFHNDLDWQRANEILLEEFPREFKGDPEEKNLFDQNVRFLKMYIEKVKTSDLRFLERLGKFEG